ncbi:Elongator subunit Elp2 [Malassezia pachydermatis]
MAVSPCDPMSQVQYKWATNFAHEVHVLRTLEKPGEQPRVLLGSYGGALEVWQARPSSSLPVTWTCEASVPDAHTAAITAIGVVRDPYSREHASNVFVTGSSDSHLHVWDVASMQCVQTISLDGAFPMDIALVRMPGPAPVMLMAVALTEKRLFLYQRDGDAPFTLCLRLEGHTDWPRALDFTVAADVHRPTELSVYLASASQDSHIRLWKWQTDVSGSCGDTNDTTPRDTFEEMAQDLMPDDQGIKTKTHWLTMGGRPWALSLDALLLGHDAWVTDVRWCPTRAGTAPRAVLLSSSVDNSVMMWSPHVLSSDATSAWCALSDPEAAQSMWLPMHRLGDVGSLSGGFLGARWHPSSAWHTPAVAAHDRQGALHVWQRSADKKWAPLWTVSGHAGAAQSVAWEPLGDYFLSTGLDRTTRLHGTWHNADTRTWHELARPQTHGYDMHDAAWLDRTTFVSAADEKVLRVFGAPQAFVTSAQQLRTFQTMPQTRHVLALEVRERAQWHQGEALRDAMYAAMESRPAALSVLVFAEALHDCTRAWPSSTCSLRDVEALLQQLYLQAWAAAVAQDHLLADITVYILPAASSTPQAQALVTQWARTHTMVQGLWDVEGAFRPASSWSVWPLPVHTVPLGPCSSDVPPMEYTSAAQGPVVAVGGTFDHLHIGHKLLLSMAALCATDTLIVGVTGPELLTSKKHREYVESIEHRQAAVRHFVRDLRSTIAPLHTDCVAIHDVCGPAGTAEALRVLVLTEETVSGGQVIADTRAKNGVPPVHTYVVRLVDAHGNASSTAASKVGSTGIRAWLAAKHIEPGMEATQLLGGALETRASAAHVPPLGLSNRAVESSSSSSDVATPTFTTPPGPESLASLTLWPELEKLYGHGYELLSVAIDPVTQLIASTCKATTATHAVVRLFDGQARFKPCGSPLEGHALSITRVAFSPDGRYLLSVSRDRSWRVFVRHADEYVPWIGERAHARILWDGAWAWEAPSTLFATASRDKTVKVWSLIPDTSKPYTLCATLALKDAVTCVAWGPQHTLAVGLEGGDVVVYTAERTTSSTYEWRVQFTLSRHHTGTVHRLAFRPPGAWEDSYHQVSYQLLSAGDDGCVRLVSWP